jgi:hypothetical protein
MLFMVWIWKNYFIPLRGSFKKLHVSLKIGIFAKNKIAYHVRNYYYAK